MPINARNLRLGPANVIMFAKAQATGAATGAANSQLRFTAKVGGAAGNDITVEYLAPAGTTTTVAITGTDIVVSPKTGATGAEVMAALQASGAARLILANFTSGHGRDGGC